MNEDRDPLDGLFEADPAPVTLGDDTQGGNDTVSAGDNTQTAQEAPGKDSIDAGDGNDTVSAPESKVKMVPLAALDEARERARAAEERLAKSGTGADTQTASDDAFEMIDPKEDPAGAYNQMLGIVQLNAVNTTLNFSEKAARKEHGAELVDKVMEWATARFEKEPDFATRVLTDPDPYEVAIADYKKAQRDEKLDKIDPAILEGLDEDEIKLLEQHRASKKAAAGGEDKGGSTDQNAQPRGEGGRFVETPPRRNVEPPPKSIAGAPSGGKAGGNLAVASGEGVAFDETFGGR